LKANSERAKVSEPCCRILSYHLRLLNADCSGPTGHNDGIGGYINNRARHTEELTPLEFRTPKFHYPAIAQQGKRTGIWSCLCSDEVMNPSRVETPVDASVLWCAQAAVARRLRSLLPLDKRTSQP